MPNRSDEWEKPQPGPTFCNAVDAVKLAHKFQEDSRRCLSRRAQLGTNKRHRTSRAIFNGKKIYLVRSSLRSTREKEPSPTRQFFAIDYKRMARCAVVLEQREL